ncbi:radical SAM family heme chaperone HemW [Myxococcota bacterium]|nr:radical SAM family heme chaperone HemW [Myxococcota bacterium]
MSSADLGLYVHFPYCEKKCPYCDFNVVAIRHDDHAYADAVLAELAARAPAFLAETPRFRTLYFGGGTPSEWAPDALARVIDAVRPRLDPRAEITLEANPGTIADAHIAAFAAAGVNRFSIGAQSALDHELELLGRTHRAGDVARTVEAAKRAGARVSVDLIYGLPYQDEDALSRSIDAMLALGVDHLSAYTLTIEPRTLFAKRVRQGRLTVVDDDRQASLVEHLTASLARAGFERYEISSYAPPGQEAVHNSIYWAGGPYLGVGAGAHSYLPAPGLRAALRRETLRAPRTYVAEACAGRFPAGFEETLDRDTAIADRLLVGVRTKWGLDVGALDAEAEQHGALVARLGPILDALAAEGLITREGAVARPTARGFLFGDLIARRLLDAAARSGA